MAKALKGTKTHENLKHAFAGESQANRRYLYFARRADIEGYPDIGGLFRDTSEAETGHAFGHLDFLKEAELDRVGCFAYSPVDGAAANALPDAVPEPVREERRERLMALQAGISAARECGAAVPAALRSRRAVRWPAPRPVR